MTTTQIIIFTIMGFLALIGFTGAMLGKKESTKFLFIFLLLFTTFLFATIAILLTEERAGLLNKIKGKCPEYEKIENVYRLK